MTTTFQQISRTLKNLTVYFSMPAFNINWTRTFDFAGDFLALHPITVVDIGSRDGSCEELENLAKYCEYVGFDADLESVANDKINPSLKKWKKADIYNKFIGTHNGLSNFNLYVRKSESSLLEPSPSYQQNFSSRLRVESTVQVKSVILEDALAELRVMPDMIKLDTQGTEFDVIASSKSVFSNSLMVEVEVEFLEMYQNQKLFPDVSQILYESGHQLLYVNRVFGNMNNSIVKSRGQLVFADMLFGLNYNLASSLELSRKYKYILLLMNYGHNDFAYQLYVNDSDFVQRHPELLSEFRKLEKKVIRHKFRMMVITQLDKLAFVYLTLRRTNSLHFDSDRSWPIR